MLEFLGANQDSVKSALVSMYRGTSNQIFCGGHAPQPPPIVPHNIDYTVQTILIAPSPRTLEHKRR